MILLVFWQWLLFIFFNEPPTILSILLHWQSDWTTVREAGGRGGLKEKSLCMKSESKWFRTRVDLDQPCLTWILILWLCGLKLVASLLSLIKEKALEMTIVFMLHVLTRVQFDGFLGISTWLQVSPSACISGHSLNYSKHASSVFV